MIGARAEALFTLARTTHPDWLELLADLAAVSTLDLADSLAQAFADDIRASLPDAPPLGPVLHKVARYIRASSWYGNTRVLIVFSWAKGAGFSVAPSAPLPHGKEIAALWGERVKVPLKLARAMKRLGNCSGRSLCENGTQLEVLCGPLAFTNCACVSHANIRPHGIFGLLTCGATNTLVPEDWTHAIPHQGRILPGCELTIHYGEPYARKLPCSLCSDVAPPHTWRRVHKLEFRATLSALKQGRKEAKLKSEAMRGVSPCAPLVLPICIIRSSMFQCRANARPCPS